ncbi:octopamine receptor-like [Asterias rubens]|uniref:octopamine receptor-like n=1 Tax=Asterias rubens TaxID=7604 RepID=UPI0014558A8C|nr:octopamine receptor-like [Asterias rubens]XP_033631131.1 octopamine receptor-like [Asterias rubens]
MQSKSKMDSSHNISGPVDWENNPVTMIITIAGAVVVLLISTTTVFGSLLVILAVHKFKRLQIPSNYILVNLAAADISVAVFIPLLYVTLWLRPNVYLCSLAYSLVILGCGVSLLSLGVVAYDRYAALVKPLKYCQHITTKRVVGFSAAIWLYVAVIAFAPICWNYVESILDSEPLQDAECSFKLLNRYVVLFQLTATFLPVFLLMIGCYCRVMLVARHHSRAISAIQLSLFPNSFNKNFHMFKGNKYSRTLLIILGFFCVTWVIFTLTLLVEKFCTICGEDVAPLHKYSSFLIFANSCLNPWIYAHRNQDFKSAFKRLARALFCMKKRPRSSSQSGEGRRNSRFSDALSRTNSMVGGLQHLHILYDNADIVPSTAVVEKTHVAPKLIQHDVVTTPVVEMHLEAVADVIV